MANTLSSETYLATRARCLDEWSSLGQKLDTSQRDLKAQSNEVSRLRTLFETAMKVEPMFYGEHSNDAHWSYLVAPEKRS